MFETQVNMHHPVVYTGTRSPTKVALTEMEIELSTTENRTMLLYIHAYSPQPFQEYWYTKIHTVDSRYSGQAVLSQG